MKHDEDMKAWIDGVRKAYHAPPETPREEIWDGINARLRSHETVVVDIESARAARAMSVRSRNVGWAVAAAAVLVLGVGIGRMTAPAVDAPTALEASAEPASVLAYAQKEHLGRTESLLAMVRTDARAGRIDPATAQWANGLLTQTRLLLDANEGRGATEDLLLDLELVLVQIVGIAESGPVDDSRARTELALALQSLDEGALMGRLQAALPAMGAGT